MLLVVHAGSSNLLSFLLLLTLLLTSRHASCNDIHDATPTCCMTHPHYIPPTQVNHFLRISMECSLYKYLAHTLPQDGQVSVITDGCMWSILLVIPFTHSFSFLCFSLTNDPKRRRQNLERQAQKYR